MEKINWRRVVLGGVLAGVVLIALITGLLALFGGQPELRTALQALRAPTRGAADLLFALFAFLFLGMLMTFWYAAIRPRFGPGPKTAAIAALAVWLIVVSQLLKNVAMNEPVSNLPAGPMLPILYLLTIIASTEVGAWVYKER